MFILDRRRGAPESVDSSRECSQNSRIPKRICCMTSHEISRDDITFFSVQ